MRKISHLSEILTNSILLLLYAFVCLIASRKQTGYEPSFYSGLPVWYFLVITLGFALLVGFLFYALKEKSLFFLMVTSVFVFIIASIWIIKYGKPYGIGDIYIHLFSVTKIETTSYIPINNFYPITHIFLATLYYITTINNYTLITWSTPLLFPLFVIFVYLIGKELFGENVGWIATFFVILSPFLMLEHTALKPQILSYLFLYMGIWLLIKNLENTQFSLQILLLFISSIMIFTHFQTAILFLSTILCFYLIWVFLNKIYFKRRIKTNWWVTYIIILAISLLSIWFFLANPYLKKLFISMLRIFHSSFSSPSIGERTITIRPLQKFLVRRINIVITTFLSATILFYYGLKNFKKVKSKITPYNLFIITYITICAIFYFISTIFISKEFGISGRYVWMASLIYPVLMGYAFHKVIFLNRKRSNSKRSLFIKYFITILILSLLFFVSIMEMYPRPEQGYYSPYTTDNVFVGMRWGYAHMNHSNSKIMGGGDQFNALALYMFGERNYSMFRGSTNGLLKFLGYNPRDYEHRGVHEMYRPDNKIQYIYYEPLMSYFLANPKYAKSIVTVRQTDLEEEKDLQKIYDSKDFCVYQLLK